MFAKVSDYAGASFFKPAEYLTALALLVEPKSIQKDVPSTYNNQTRNRDELIADISVFANQADLDSNTPSTVMKSTKIVHGMLTSTAEKFLDKGEIFASVVQKIPTQAGSGYVFRDVDAATSGKVEAYYAARTEAAANAPGFD